MKKILFFALLSIFATTVFAAPVSRQQADKAAQYFWRNVLQMRTPLKLSEHQPYDAMYLFTSERGGFVIVAADDAAKPILGYSVTGTLNANNLSDNLTEWLDIYQSEIDYARTATMASGKEWDALFEMHPDGAKDSIDVVGPLMTTRWMQMSPYNDSCPLGAATGCVATGTAQVMKFWNFPPFGEGSHSFTPQNNYGVQYADFGHARYDWEHMPDVLTYNSSSIEKAAVAKLMYHVGVSINMGYSPIESGATVAANGNEDNYCAENALWKFFHYDHNDLNYQFKGSTSNEEWTDMLIDELRTYQRPILYSAMSPVGGHTFVCDGYDSRRYLHFNLGQGGEGDGYYAIGAINALGSFGYNSANNALMGIHPVQHLFLNEKELYFNRQGGTKDVWMKTCDTCSDNWTATPSDSWISIDDSDFDSTLALHIVCEANSSDATRSGSIVVSQGGVTRTIDIIQMPYDTSELCPLTVVMESTHHEAWENNAYLSFESLDGYVFGTAAHISNTASSTVQIDVAPHDVKCVWHAGGPKDRYINYKVLNHYGETLIDVSNAYYNGGDVLLSWPCAHVGIDTYDDGGKELSISPNPASSTVTLNGIEPHSSVNIVDLNGRIVMHQEHLSTSEQLVLDVTVLNNGVYLVHIRNDRQNLVKKLIIK